MNVQVYFYFDKIMCNTKIQSKNVSQNGLRKKFFKTLVVWEMLVSLQTLYITFNNGLIKIVKFYI